MNDLDFMPNQPTLEQIQALESVMRDMPQVEIPVTHHFAPGLYAREITIPAGVCVVGKLHRHTHLIQLVKGEVEIRTDAGMQRLVGPAMWSSQAGTKRAILAIEDATLITFHVTNETDMEAIEADVIEPEVDALAGAQGVLT